MFLEDRSWAWSQSSLSSTGGQETVAVAKVDIVATGYHGPESASWNTLSLDMLPQEFKVTPSLPHPDLVWPSFP